MSQRFTWAMISATAAFSATASGVLATDGMTFTTMAQSDAWSSNPDGEPSLDTDPFWLDGGAWAQGLPGAYSGGHTAGGPGTYTGLNLSLIAGSHLSGTPIDSGMSGSTASLAFTANVPLQYSITYRVNADAGFTRIYGDEDSSDLFAVEAMAYTTGFFSGAGSVSVAAAAARQGPIERESDSFEITYIGTSAAGAYSMAVESELSFTKDDFGIAQGDGAAAGASLDAVVVSLPTGAMSLNPGTWHTLGVANGTSAVISNNAAPAAFSVVNIGSTAKLDVASGNVVTNVDGANAVALSEIRAKIASGYGGGSWSGYGITSSTAAANASYGIGYARAGDIGVSWFNNLAVPADAIILDYCLTGDLNLDGTVDFADMLKLTQFYNVSISGRVWSEGDVNYDGYVNYDDLLALNQNLYESGLQDAIDTGLFTGEVLAALQRAAGQVPEPLAACVICAAITTTRRRRVI